MQTVVINAKMHPVDTPQMPLRHNASYDVRLTQRRREWYNWSHQSQPGRLYCFTDVATHCGLNVDGKCLQIFDNVCDGCD